MAIYGFLNEQLIKNDKDKEAEYKRVLPKVQSATKKVLDRYSKDQAVRKRISSLLKSYLKKMEDDNKHKLDKNEIEDAQYYIDHPDEVNLKYYPKCVNYSNGEIVITITDLNHSTSDGVESLIRAIGKDIEKELGDIGTPYTITGPDTKNDDFGNCHFKLK